MSYPFAGRPVYLALAPLTHAAGVLCFPIMALGGEIVDHAASPTWPSSSRCIERHRVTHTFLPPTLIYMLLGHADARRARTCRRCSASGTAPRRCRRPGWRRRSTPDRAGDGAAVRPDRGADDDLDDGAGRALPPRRHRRHGTAGLGRAARRRWSPSRSWTRTARCSGARRARRDRRPQFAGDGGLLQEPGGHGRGVPRTAGTTPATSATSTRTATCSSSTGPRT